MVDGGGDVMTTASITRGEWRVVRCEWQQHERRRKSGVSWKNGETVDHLTRIEGRDGRMARRREEKKVVVVVV
jgi:hypothetical protein